jgi:hypothetical protein
MTRSAPLAVRAAVALALAACSGGTGSTPGGTTGTGGTCSGYKPIASFEVVPPSGLYSLPVYARRPWALDATRSYSPSGATLSYAWSLASRPAGSATGIVGGGVRPSITPDVAGNYTVSLVVTDACGPSAARTSTIQAVEGAPVAMVAGSDRPAFAFPAPEIAIDASQSYDPNGDPIWFSWVLTPPAGSACALVDPGAPVARFTPDVEGYYDLALTVSDHGPETLSYSSRAHVVVGVFHPALGVPYYAIDAAYSGALDRFVIVTSEPALRIVNPHDATTTAIALDAYAYAVSLSPDGLEAAVSQRTHFSVVDLVGETVTDTFAPADSLWTYDGGDVVLDGQGWAYAFPAVSITAGPLVVKLSDGTVTSGASAADPEASTAAKPKLDSTGTKMFELGAYMEGIRRFYVSPGAITYGSTNWGSGSEVSGPFLSPGRIYTGTGTMWSPTDLTPGASLRAPGETTTFGFIDDSITAGEILATCGNVYGPDSFRLYDRYSFALLEKRFFPAVISNGTATVGTVTWAYWKPDGSGYYVVFVSSGLTGIAEYP